MVGLVIEKKALIITPNEVQPVLNLQSTQEEADTRVFLHAIYCVQHNGTERIVIYANDTDVIVLAIYYASKHRDILQEQWVRNAPQSFLPIHEIAQKLGTSLC